MAARRPRTTSMAKAKPGGKAKAGAAEFGYSGLNVSGGVIREEFLTQLQGRQGRNIFTEMAYNDPIIGAVLFAASMLIRQSEWGVRPGEDTPEGHKLAEFVESCRQDMSQTWSDVISEIMTMLPYGWSALEIVYKKRSGKSKNPSDSSRFNDGMIGWRKLPARAQVALDGWELDEQGGVIAMKQLTSQGKRATIPIDRLLLFRTLSDKNNPEGRSALRNAYRPWFFKKRIEEVEGIGIERDLAGLPVLTPPEDVDLWNADDPDAVTTKAVAEKLVQSIRRDEQEGVLLPHGWTLTLLSTGGKRSFDTSGIITRYDTRIAMTVLADFIILGHNNRYGSFALAQNKTQMFSVAIGGWLQAIADVFNRYAIPRLLDLNGIEVEKPPMLVPGDVEIPDLQALGGFIKTLTDAGMTIFPDEKVEKRVLQLAGLPWAQHVTTTAEAAEANRDRARSESSGKTGSDASGDAADVTAGDSAEDTTTDDEETK